MEAEKEISSASKGSFGTAPVYFTAISSILGAILFLRLGFATGTLGFWGAIFVVMLGHLITIPTALAISELATNTRVEGGGEYFIISRSFGLKIGTTIGIALFLSQTISIAFYTIAFAEAFQPFFEWFVGWAGFELPRQVVSVPTLLVMAYVILYKGTGSGVKLLYIVTLVLGIALVMFFLGRPIEPTAVEVSAAETKENFGFFNRDNFFLIFAICFPAFTGMTAGVGLSGDLKNPGRSIPVGTMAATFTGLIIYILVILKLSVSASQADLIGDQMVMSRIALFGSIVIPMGIAACTSSSALGAMMVAPRTLQAIAADDILPIGKINKFFSRGRGKTNEPHNASIISFAIALVFVLLGDVNSVAIVISMFFLITYGTLCLSSFLNHFGSPPSYRPRFKSRWYLSLTGFLMSVWVMFMINSFYTIVSYLFIVLIYLFIEHSNKGQAGLVNIFKGALFQLNRQLQVYMQKHQASMEREEWRPAAICVSPNSFEREKVLELMKWISYQHGFGTYFHYINGYYSKQTCKESKEVLDKLVSSQKLQGGTLYIDTIVSPSYTSVITQVMQSPSISGMENNMAVFEYDKQQPKELERILENVNMVKAGDFDICIYAISEFIVRPQNGIHVWLRDTDEYNTNFMILLGYIIMAHPAWRNSHIKIFMTSPKAELVQAKANLEKLIKDGRLPASSFNVEIVPMAEDQTFGQVVSERSRKAGLTMIGFREEAVKHNAKLFTEFDEIGDILFVNSTTSKDIC